MTHNYTHKKAICFALMVLLGVLSAPQTRVRASVLDYFDSAFTALRNVLSTPASQPVTAAVSSLNPTAQGQRKPVATASAASKRAKSAQEAPAQTQSNVIRGANAVAAVLYDQINNASGDGTSIQDFEATYDQFDSEGADDFVVPANRVWTIDTVNIGTVNSAAGAFTADVTFYTNSGTNFPASAVCTRTALPVNVVSNGTTIIPLGSPCAFTQGTYWVAVQINMNFDPNSTQVFWASRTVQTNNGGVWRNPGNSFGSGCTSFNRKGSCPIMGGNDDQFPDWQFSLEGTDTQACAITCPANITVPNTTGQCSAVVTYPAPTTTGVCGTVTCTPASGSTFPVGVTTVTCNTTGLPMPSCTFTITVQDTQAPTITCPPNQTAFSASGNPIPVTYPAPTATDNCPGVTVACVPASGSNFAVGVTTVTCTAMDTSPNSPNTTCSFTVTVNSFTPAPIMSLVDPLNCNGPGDVITGSVTLANPTAFPQTGMVSVALPPGIIGLPGTCVSNIATCTTTATTVSWSGTIPANSTLTITSQAQFADNVAPGTTLCAVTTAVFNGVTGTAQGCLTINCPAAGPGVLPGPNNALSDQKPGSVLFYNLVSSSASNATTQNARVSLTNTNPTRTAFVHLFFVDGSNCSVADSFVCLTPNQTATFLHSDVDPGTTGYVVAVATDRNGCPISFNYLIGDEYVKLASGHAANLAAESIAARAGGATFCAPTASDAVLAFNDVAYDAVPRVLALDNFASPADGNQTLLVVNRIGGFLSTGAFTTGTLFGILYDDSEQALSFSLGGGACQVRANLNGSTVRTTPRVEQFVPTGRTGWLKVFNNANDFGLLGAALTFNASAATQVAAFNQGHNLHKLRLSQAAVYTIPIFPPSC